MISVVMLIRDRLKLTQQALDSLYNNTRELAMLTVVDDASQPETRDWLRAQHLHNLVRNEESKGTGWARNQGIEAARAKYGTGPLLYLSDNDVYFKPGWDEVLRYIYRTRPDFKVIGGGCHPYLQAKQSPLRFVYANQWYMLASRDAVSGYSWLLSWETYDKYGPFDQHALGVRQSEDFAVCQKIIKDGYYVGSVVPEVVAHTGVTDTFGQRPPGWELIEKGKVPGVLYE